MLIEKIFCQRPCIAETLQCAAHKASISKISETDNTSLCIFLSFHFHCLSIDYQFCSTFVQMISLIIFLASFRAVLHLFTSTSDFKYRSLIASFAFSIFSWILIICKDKWAIVSFYFDNKQITEIADAVYLTNGLIHKGIELQTWELNPCVFLNIWCSRVVWIYNSIFTTNFIKF